MYKPQCKVHRSCKQESRGPGGGGGLGRGQERERGEAHSRLASEVCEGALRACDGAATLPAVLSVNNASNRRRGNPPQNGGSVRRTPLPVKSDESAPAGEEAKAAPAAGQTRFLANRLRPLSDRGRRLLGQKGTCHFPSSPSTGALSPCVAMGKTARTRVRLGEPCVPYPFRQDCSGGPGRQGNAPRTSPLTRTTACLAPGGGAHVGACARVAKSGLENIWGLWGWIWERAGFGEGRGLSTVQCHRVHPLKQPFPPGELISVG
ncbi:UNVERIFIED_CONTAM: hypothetical protein K2H54_010295 [Gekko kuhli]